MSEWRPRRYLRERERKDAFSWRKGRRFPDLSGATRRNVGEMWWNFMGWRRTIGKTVSLSFVAFLSLWSGITPGTAIGIREEGWSNILNNSNQYGWRDRNQLAKGVSLLQIQVRYFYTHDRFKKTLLSEVTYFLPLRHWICLSVLNYELTRWESC